MTSGSTLRTPPRRWWPARSAAAGFAALLCIALTLTLGAGRAEGYPCGEPRPGRTLSVAVAEPECPRAEPAPKPRRKTDVLSLAFFVGMLGIALLIPIEYSRRRNTGPE
jgi:hypothetical protein